MAFFQGHFSNNLLLLSLLVNLKIQFLLMSKEKKCIYFIITLVLHIAVHVIAIYEFDLTKLCYCLSRHSIVQYIYTQESKYLQ